jgi:hypothetical protein
MSKYDDLYTNPAHTKAIFPQNKISDNYIKSHVQVIAPVQYTNQLPMEAKLLVYVFMVVIVVSLLHDGYCVVKNSINLLKKCLT